MAETSSVKTAPNSGLPSAGNVDTGQQGTLLARHGTIEETTRLPLTAEPQPYESVGAQDGTSDRANSQSRQDDSATQPDPQKARTQKTNFFGISQGQGRFDPGFVNNNFDYYQKYPEDEWGEEWGENARVWKVYLDEAQIYDTETTEGWKDTLNVFLVFAGLFSAVEASFITISIQALQPDYAQANAFLLMEQISLQRAIAAGHSPDTIPPAPFDAHIPASPSLADLWVNGLWFVSLALSLCVALAAVVIKQWIQEYVRITSGTPKSRARVRQFRFAGLERWGVPVIIGILPVLLHTALFLFLVGLVIFTLPLSGAIGALTLALAAVTLGIYVSSMTLSLVFLDCPYKTPIAAHIHDLLVIPLVWALQRVHKDCLFYLRTAWVKFLRPFRCRAPRRPLPYRNCFIPRIKTKQSREDGAIESRGDELDLSSVAWLHLRSSNMTAFMIALESISSLPTSIPPQTLVSSLSNNTEHHAYYQFTSCFSQSAAGTVLLKDNATFSQVEKLGRAALRLRSSYWITSFEARLFRFLTAPVPQQIQRADRVQQLGQLGLIVFCDGSDWPDDLQDRTESILVDLIRDGHPSLVTFIVRALLGTKASGSGHPWRAWHTLSSQSEQNLALEVFRRIPASFAFKPEETVFLQWSAAMICSQLPRDNSSALPGILRAFEGVDQADCPMNLQSHGLAILLLFHTAHHLTDADLLSSQEILIMMARECRPVRSAFFASPCGILYFAIVASVTPNRRYEIFGSLSAKSTQRQHDPKHTFEEEDMKTCAALSAPLEYSSVDWHIGADQIITLVRCLSRYLERSIAESNAPLDTHPALQPWLERIHEDSSIMRLLTRALTYNFHGENDAEYERWFGIYARSVHHAAQVSSGFAHAVFTAIRALLEDDNQHFLWLHGSGILRYGYLVAVLEKLKEIDSSCGGLENIDEDGISNMVVYRRLEIYGKEPAGIKIKYVLCPGLDERELKPPALACLS